MLALVLVAAGLATYFQRQAVTRADEAAAATVQAEANRLAQLSGTVGGLDTSLLLAVEALNTADTPATRDGLLGRLLEHRHAEQVMPLDGNVTTTALADDGSRLFVGVRDHVAAWQVGSPEPPAKVIDIPINSWVLRRQRQRAVRARMTRWAARWSGWSTPTAPGPRRSAASTGWADTRGTRS